MIRATARRTDSGSPRASRPPASPALAAGLAAVLTALVAAPGTARGQEAEVAGDCFRSWTVNTMKETEAFRVDRSPWALRWSRATEPHSDLDGLFAELFRVEEGEKTEDQVTAVNTDHEGHEGTVTVEETGTFWMSLESWSEETGWRIEACLPRDSAGSW